MTRIEQPGKRISAWELARLEKTLNAPLPKPYRRFLEENNGGLPSPDTVDVPGAPWRQTDVQVFFGIERDVESSDLEWNVRTFSRRIPERLLPIACDSGGNLFCVALSGRDAGAIFYCDVEGGEELYLVAPDFDAFLAMMYPLDASSR